MSWFTLFFALQAGIVSQQVLVGPSMWSTPPQTTEVTMSAKAVLLDHIELSGFMRSWQTPIGGAFFDPFRIDYGASAALTLGGLRIGVQHECDHPIGSPDLQSTIYGLGSTEFFIRFEGKLGF